MTVSVPARRLFGITCLATAQVLGFLNDSILGPQLQCMMACAKIGIASLGFAWTAHLYVACPQHELYLYVHCFPDWPKVPPSSVATHKLVPGLFRHWAGVQKHEEKCTGEYQEGHV